MNEGRQVEARRAVEGQFIVDQLVRVSRIRALKQSIMICFLTSRQVRTLTGSLYFGIELVP